MTHETENRMEKLKDGLEFLSSEEFNENLQVLYELKGK